VKALDYQEYALELFNGFSLSNRERKQLRYKLQKKRS